MVNRRKLAAGAIILIILIIAAITVVFFEAKSQKDQSELTPSALIPPEQYISAALSGEAFSTQLYAVDKDIGFMLYGLNAADYTFAEFYFSDGATAEEFVYLTANSVEAYDALVSAVNRRIKEQIVSYTDYVPSEVPKLEGATVQYAPDNLTLTLAVANDYDKLPKTLYEE